MTLLRAILLFLAFLLADTAFAAAFECTKASTATEKPVRASPALFALDDQSRTDMLICNDDMVGHFAMDRIEVDRETDKALIDYVNTKCFGG